MSQDISAALEGWDFQPHELNVRMIRAADGAERIQMRIDLGLLQMFLDGRPDGKRPFDCDSLLEYYERQAAEYGEGYRLSAESIDDLFREAWQFYHRYLCLFHLANYSLVVRDTERTLRLFHFVKKHAKKKREQWRFDQYRPYVIMMYTRARAMIALGHGDRDVAIENIEDGRRGIEEFLEEYGRSEERGDYFELEFLTRWIEELKTKDEPAPASSDGEQDEEAKLRSYLQKAIEREDYEYAALLRDKIKRNGLSDLKSE